METILIATDFSDVATHAARYAALISRCLGVGRILIYHAYDPLPTAMDQTGAMLIAYNEIYQGNIRLLNDLKEEIQQVVGSAVEIITKTNTQQLELGIGELAKEYAVKMLVIGLTGKNKLERFLMGSNTSSLLRRSELPLLVIPGDAKYAPITKMVFACDFKDVGGAGSICFIKDLVHKLNAELLILNVVNKDNEQDDTRFEDTQKTLHQHFDGLGASFHYSGNDRIEEGILSFTKAHQAQLVIAVTKGRHGFLDRLLHESVSKKVVLFSSFPTLVLR